MQFIDLQSQLAQIRPAIDKRIATVLDHGQFIMGPEVFELEEKLAHYTGAGHCVSCANGTDALQLALMALELKPGELVMTTAFSFFATAEVIPAVGAVPYFVDVNPATYNLCPDALKNSVHIARQRGYQPKAVIAADMFGLPADYLTLSEFCRDEGLYLIEDGAQSFGGAIGEHMCGSFGDLATTSFFPAKPLGCYGDGGAVFTHNKSLAERVRSLSLHGKGSHKYEHLHVGMNSRLDTLQAAILLEKLTLLDDEIRARNTIADFYNAHLSDHFVIPDTPPGMRSAWAQYTLQAKHHKRENILQTLAHHNIPSGIYYPTPLHRQPAMQNALFDNLVHSEVLANTVFSLPFSACMPVDEQQLVVNALAHASDGAEE